MPSERDSRLRLQRWQKYSLTFCLSLLLTLSLTLPMLFSPPPWVTGAAAVNPIQTPLSTRGTQIVDANGNAVLLRGVNWFGMETVLNVPHGLWLRDYKGQLAQIKSLGYNTIRLPYSVQSLRSQTISGVDFSLGSNAELQGKTPLEVMDLVVQEAERQGLMILLDSHRLNDQRIPELWYGDGFTEEDWIQTWTLLAQRYRNQRNVIGADLKNEPHGAASWGTGDRATDWRLAAERAGNAILRVNPDWLIVVEGVERNVPGQQLAVHWWGGNLEGVRRFPVRISNPRKLVYSPHEYGPGAFNQTWFSEPSFPQNLYRRWDIGFNYIVTEGIAPVLVGEFGGRQVDQQSKEGIWQRQFVDFIQQHRLNFTYWSWNPNSGDTGGILQDDWQTIDAPKQALLNRLLPVPLAVISPSRSPAPPPPAPTPRPSASVMPRPAPLPSASATPRPVAQPSASPTRSPAASSAPVISAASALRSELVMQSDWDAGFCSSIRVTNRSSAPVRGWRLTFEMNQAAISQSWNGTFNRQGSRYVVTPADWGRELAANRSIEMGFCATKQGSDYRPRSLGIL